MCERIAKILRGRGHRVWMDSVELKAGDKWAEEMARGVDSVKGQGDRGRFLYMMAPWGIRRSDKHKTNGGFCINELTKCMNDGLQHRMLAVVLCPCAIGGTLPADMPCIDTRGVFPD